MNTSQLECMIDCDPMLRDNVIGVYGADQLPLRRFRKAYGFIANTRPYPLPGHWCAFYDDGLGHVMFFDSYGRIPSQNSVYFERWIHRMATTVQMNRVQIQSDDSTVCGLYCIMFLRHLLNGDTLDDFIQSFDSNNTLANDSFIYRVVTHAYSCCFGKNSGQICNSLCQNV